MAHSAAGPLQLGAEAILPDRLPYGVLPGGRLSTPMGRTAPHRSNAAASSRARTQPSVARHGACVRTMTPGVPSAWGFLFLALIVYIPPIVVAVVLLRILRWRGRVPGVWGAFGLFYLCQTVGLAVLLLIIGYGPEHLLDELPYLLVSGLVPSLIAAAIRMGWMEYGPGRRL